MRLFKRNDAARFCPECREKFEALRLGNERPENDRDDRLAADQYRVKGEGEAIKIETKRGWCSWGF